MANDEFDPNWPHGHVTRGGHKARIICTDAAGSYPIIALVSSDAREEIHRYTWEGKFFTNYGACPDPYRHFDLINTPAPVVRKSRWMNIHAGNGWPVRDGVDYASEGRIGLLEIIYEKGRPVDVKLHKIDGGGDACDR